MATKIVMADVEANTRKHKFRRSTEEKKDVDNSTHRSTVFTNPRQGSNAGWGDVDINICLRRNIGSFAHRCRRAIEVWTVSLQAFQWCFGFNKDLPVLNLSINNTKKIFFVAAQIGVLYDFANNRQQLLIGHVNRKHWKSTTIFRFSLPEK